MKVNCEMCNKTIKKIHHKHCIVAINTADYIARYFCKENYRGINNYCYISYLSNNKFI